MANIKELNPNASPQAAYGARLRKMRESRGWIQDHFASVVGCSGRHVSAIETGRKPATLMFSRKADAVFGLAGTSESFEREWRKLKRGSMLEGFPEYVGYEGRAVEIRLFQVSLIPGLMQTPEYARALNHSYVQRGSVTAEQAEERVSLVLKRQATLVRQRPPVLFVIVDESCLLQAVGGPQVMNRQLERLEELATLPNWFIHVAPFSLGERRAFHLPVNLLTLPDRSVVAYAESEAQGHVERETSLVVPMLTAYHQLQGESLSQAASVALINRLRKGAP
ncbi:helix-turn-helix transcriptional regulator [Streptomyces sp. SAS_281]|uniref:helix-turn-helix domain-containing protein n=1 Tax=Streptomyces sp. SAS_281 TaxID=3412744 RepID=UPI00403C6242